MSDDVMQADETATIEAVTDNLDPIIETEGADDIDPAPEVADAKLVQQSVGVQKRIDELTRRRYEAEREAAYWRGQAESGRSVSDESSKAEAKDSGYRSYEDYLEAVADRKVSEKLAAERERIQREEAMAMFSDRVQSARKAHSDYDDVVFAPDLRISDAMREALIAHPDGADIAYYLGSHRGECDRIFSLSPIQQLMEIGRLGSGREKSKPATEPVSPLRGSDGTFVKDPERMTDAEWWTSEEAKRKRR